MTIEDKKFDYLNDDKKGKAGIMKSLGFDNLDKKTLTEILFQHIKKNYIYNLERTTYGNGTSAIKFSICADVPTGKGNLRRTTLALDYIPDDKIIRLITLT